MFVNIQMIYNSRTNLRRLCDSPFLDCVTVALYVNSKVRIYIRGDKQILSGCDLRTLILTTPHFICYLYCFPSVEQSTALGLTLSFAS